MGRLRQVSTALDKTVVVSSNFNLLTYCQNPLPCIAKKKNFCGN